MIILFKRYLRSAMQNHITSIEELWQIRDSLINENTQIERAKSLISEIFDALEVGKISVCEKKDNGWEVNEWIKKAILLNFKVSQMKVYEERNFKWYDKVDQQFASFSREDFQKAECRIVPGAFIRKGAHVGKNTVIMPSFINLGAYVGEGTLVDTWATIGSCAHIGKNCHISGGAGIGGVLEPLQARPVIIEDNCFIGARSEIVEGVIVEEGAVISMGVFIGASTKIVYRDSGEVIYGKVPAYSVVVPGTMPAALPNLPSIYCAVIIKQVDQKTREKTAINELLRS